MKRNPPTKIYICVGDTYGQGGVSMVPRDLPI